MHLQSVTRSTISSFMTQIFLRRLLSELRMKYEPDASCTKCHELFIVEFVNMKMAETERFLRHWKADFAFFCRNGVYFPLLNKPPGILQMFK